MMGGVTMLTESMSEDHQRLFLVFRQALEDERRAQETYTEAMGITEDQALIEVFRTLLEDERRHERELLSRYEDFKARLNV
jgi:rubrerythrin